LIPDERLQRKQLDRFALNIMAEIAVFIFQPETDAMFFQAK